MPGLQATTLVVLQSLHWITMCVALCCSRGPMRFRPLTLHYTLSSEAKEAA